MILGRLQRRLRALLLKSTAERELDAELRYHLERQIEQNIQGGMSPRDARLDALRSFGGFEQAKEYCRDARGLRLLEDLLQDMRYGVRTLLNSRGFTLIAIATMALGISANTIIFSSADATMLRPLSFPNQDRLVMLFERNPEAGFSRGLVSPGNVMELRARAQTLQEIVVIENRDYVLADEETLERHTSYGVSASFFDAIGVQPQLGRGFLPGEDAEGHSQVVILRHSFWQTRFSGDPQVLGRRLLLNDKPFEVIGVMPKGFEFPYGGGEMWTPFVFDPRMTQDHGNHNLRVLSLLRPEVTVPQANAELRNISTSIQQQFPDQEGGRIAYAVALNQEYTRVAKNYVPMLIGSALFLLLTACSNVANLLLARAATRRKEMAVRLALGATRLRLMRQLLTESVLVALAGGVIGCLVAGFGLEAITKGIPTEISKFIPGWGRLGLNNTVLVFTALISVLTGILFGLAPAWQATNTNLSKALKEGGSKGKPEKSGRRTMHHSLVVVELALSVVLLIGAGLFVRSFIEILHADLGVKPDSVVTMNLALPRDKYQGEESQRDFYQRLLQRMEALPGVTGAGLIDLLPMSGDRRTGKFHIEGQPSERGKDKYTQIRLATPGYFAAIGIESRKGRLFNHRDGAQTPPVVLVNEAFVSRYFKNSDVLGRQLKLGEEERTRFEIVGVVANAMNEEMVDVFEPGVYLPFAQHPAPKMNLVVCAPNAGDQIVSALRGELATLDPRLPLAEVKMLDQIIYERRSPQALIMWILVSFSIASLLMAGAGMYAVMAYAVTQRTHEIGVRMALGAKSVDVLKLILGRGLRLTTIGLAIGLGGAVALTRFMRNLLYTVSPSDPLTFLAVVMILTVFGLLACYIPARQATKVDPLTALRYE